MRANDGVIHVIGFEIVEVEELVEVGELDPERVGTPAVFVDRIVRCDPIALFANG